MDEKQMLTEFNLLWNNIMSNQAPGLNPYEISMFLTQAQDIIVNTICESFEQTETIISYLSPLVRQATLDEALDSSNISTASDDGIDMEPDVTEKQFNLKMHIVPNSKLFVLPDNLVLRTHETLHIIKGDEVKSMDVIPVTQDAFSRTLADPFKRPNSRRALRLAFDYNVDEGNGYKGRYSEIICNDNEPGNEYKYTVRYIAKPQPIVLADLGVRSIDGVSKVNPCRLNENIQRRIIAKAVEIAKSAWS